MCMTGTDLQHLPTCPGPEPQRSPRLHRQLHGSAVSCPWLCPFYGCAIRSRVLSAFTREIGKVVPWDHTSAAFVPSYGFYKLCILSSLSPQIKYPVFLSSSQKETLIYFFLTTLFLWTIQSCALILNLHVHVRWMHSSQPSSLSRDGQARAKGVIEWSSPPGATC